MSLISELREIIREAVKDGEVVSGIEVVARFDWKWHAIPTLNEFRQAAKNIDNLQLSKDAEDILHFSTGQERSGGVIEITEADAQNLYAAYLKRMKKK